MLARGLLVAFALTGCGDKSISLALQLPSDAPNWDLSCVTTVEIYADGPNYPADTNDYVGHSLDISDAHPMTFDDVENAIRTKFDVSLPPDGLASVEMYGWNGASGFDDNPIPPPELVFFSRVPYTGQDTMTIPLVPNLSCTHQTVKVRPLDLLAFTATPGSYDCNAAAVTDATVALGTLSPGLYKDYLFYWGDRYEATLVDGVATINGSTTVGPETCLTFDGFNMSASSVACSVGRGVCGQAGEQESVFVDSAYAMSSLDATIQNTFAGSVVGVLVKNGTSPTTRAPISNAVITVDPAKGKIVYVRPDAVQAKFSATGGNTTDATGMFILYANDLVPVTFTTATATTTVMLGADHGDVAGVAVLLN